MLDERNNSNAYFKFYFKALKTIVRVGSLIIRVDFPRKFRVTIHQTWANAAVLLLAGNTGKLESIKIRGNANEFVRIGRCNFNG